MSFKNFMEEYEQSPNMTGSGKLITEIIALDLARKILGQWDDATNHYKYNWDKNKYKEWFEKETGVSNAMRIYYSPEGKVLNIKNYASSTSEKIQADTTPIAVVKKVLGSADIQKFLEEHGYTTDNLPAGFCVKGTGKTMTVGAALNAIGKNETDKKKLEHLNALLNVYSKLNDKSVAVQDASKADWILVLSRHPIDVFTISTDRDWREEGIAWIYGKWKTPSGKFEGDDWEAGKEQWKPGKWSDKMINYGDTKLSGRPDKYTSSRQSYTHSNFVTSGGWVSCSTMGAKSGEPFGVASRSVMNYIKGNAMVAYVIKKKTLSGIRPFKTTNDDIPGGFKGRYNPEYAEFDTNLNQATGRVLIYPFVNVTNGQAYLKPSYGAGPRYGYVEGETVNNILMNFLKKYQKKLPPGDYCTFAGEYNKQGVPQKYTGNNYYSDIGTSFTVNGIDMNKYKPEIFEKLDVKFDNNSLIEEGDFQHRWMLDRLIDGTIVLSKGSRLLLDDMGVTMKKGDFLKGDWKDGKWKSKGDFRGRIWYDGSFDDGSFYGKIWKNGTFRSSNGGFHGDIWEKGTFSVTKIAETKKREEIMGWHGKQWDDGDFYGTWHKGTWKKGTFKGGTWKYGIWEDGTWKFGTWKYGIWKKGDWEDGIWESGDFLMGKWEKGIWQTGNWYGRIWLTGIWKNGTWHMGEWRNGVWEDGTWKSGDWYSGIWVKGIWEHGNFHNNMSDETDYKGARKMGSYWLSGTWQAGNFNAAKWLGGTWEFGNFNGGGVWINGTWLGGKWDEVSSWHNGKNGTVETNLDPVSFKKDKEEKKLAQKNERMGAHNPAPAPEHGHA